MSIGNFTSPWVEAMRRRMNPPQARPITPGFSNANPGFTPIPGYTIQDYINMWRGNGGGGGQAPYMPTLGFPTNPGGVTSSTSYTAPNPGAAMTNQASTPGQSFGVQGARDPFARLRQQHIAQNRVPAARNPVY